jgi:hypothetical protein
MRNHIIVRLEGWKGSVKEKLHAVEVEYGKYESPILVNVSEH